MIINKSGLIIRLPVASLRVMGRATQGVKLINIKEGDAIAAVAKVEILDEEEEIAGSEQITTDVEISNEADESIIENTTSIGPEEPEQEGEDSENDETITQ